MGLYILYDRIADIAVQFFAQQSDRSAVRFCYRMLSDALMSDYLLFRVGTFTPSFFKSDGSVHDAVVVSEQTVISWELYAPDIDHMPVGEGAADA